jgi:hypothetical protein
VNLFVEIAESGAVLPALRAFDTELFFDNAPDAPDGIGAAIVSSILLLAAMLVVFSCMAVVGHSRGGGFGRLSKVDLPEIFFELFIGVGFGTGIGTMMQEGSNFGGAGRGCFNFVLAMSLRGVFSPLTSEAAALLVGDMSRPCGVEGGGGIEFRCSLLPELMAIGQDLEDLVTADSN